MDGDRPIKSITSTRHYSTHTLDSAEVCASIGITYRGIYFASG
jgi:hypothetical protein